MQEPKKPFFVLLNESTLSSKGENGYITGTDIVSDVAYCLNLWTRENVEENNEDCMTSTIQQVVNDFDWAGHVRDIMNADKVQNALPFIKKSEYLAGDYMQINAPSIFAHAVYDERKRVEKELSECYPYDEGANAPINLMASLAEARDYVEKETYENWLYGDRSTYGVIADISKKFTDSHYSATYEEKADALIIEFTEEEARDFMSYSQDEAEPVNSEKLQEIAVSWLLEKAKERAEAIETRKAARREANKVKVNREAQALEERKEEARKRKQATA